MKSVQVLAAMICLSIAVQGQNAFTYQGSLKNNGDVYDGSANMTFKLFNADVGGSQVGSTISLNGVDVAEGLFTVVLDFGNQFPGADRWLEIAVNGSTLAPRQEITAAPYAVFSDNTRGVSVSGTGNVGIGTTSPSARLHVAGTMKMDGTNTFEFGAGVPGKEINAGKVGYQSFTADALDIVGAGTTPLNRKIKFHSEGGASLTGSLGIGTTPNANSRLHVAGGSTVGLVGFFESSHTSDTRFSLHNTSSPNGRWSLLATGSASPNGAGKLVIWDDTDVVARMTFDPAGPIGIGTTSPGYPLSFANTVGDKISLYGQSGGHYGFGIQSSLLQIYADTGTSDIALGYGESSAFTETMRVKGNGRVGIGNTSPTQRLAVGSFSDSNDNYARIETLGARAGLQLRNFADVFGWTIESDESQAAIGLNIRRHSSDATGVSAMFIGRLSGNVGIGTTAPQQKLDVNGWVRCQVIQITGGSDLAEPFDVREADETKPGMVLCIDPREVGKLRLATKSYDRTVAGVVSGANGVQPGMILQQEGKSEVDGQHPVALSGRVWVYADAAFGPITAGDLLTTSDTPGHAMKVSDHSRANGAILGKAMSSLDNGRGMVLVLVGLQ